jgi:hypothetical protein
MKPAMTKTSKDQSICPSNMGENEDNASTKVNKSDVNIGCMMGATIPSADRKQMTINLSHSTGSEQRGPSPENLEQSKQSTAFQIIDSLYHERPGLNFLSDYDSELSLKQHAPDAITQQNLLDMKKMVKEVKANPSLIYDKFNLPWNQKMVSHNTVKTLSTGKDNSIYENYSPNCVTQVSHAFSKDQFPEPPLSDPKPSSDEPEPQKQAPYNP